MESLKMKNWMVKIINSAICNYDEDDFEKFNKYAMFLDYYRIKIIGEGVYDLSIAYCNECNLDGGDYNDCNDLVIKFERVGDGICDGGSYNSEECKYDGGDCSMCNRIVDDFQKMEIVFVMAENVLQIFTIWMEVTAMIAKISLKTLKELEMEYVIGIITI